MRTIITTFAALGIVATSGAQSQAQLYDPYYDETVSVDPYDDYYDDDDYDDGYYDDGYYDDGYYDDSYGEQSVSIDLFRRELSPHGTWVNTPEYGLVWIPSVQVVGQGFIPYATGGSWRYSNAGWTFASSWDWGWAPFHYGRWYQHARYGWAWVPGTQWAPSWVDWRYGDGYVGWAPLPPARHTVVLSDPGYWFFCSPRDMFRPYVHRYRVPSSRYVYHSTRYARRPVHRGRVSYYAGPRPELIERHTRVRVPRTRIAPRNVTRDHRSVRGVGRDRALQNRAITPRRDVRSGIDRSRIDRSRIDRSRIDRSRIDRRPAPHRAAPQRDVRTRIDRRAAPQRAAPQRDVRSRIDRRPAPQRAAPQRDVRSRIDRRPAPHRAAPQRIRPSTPAQRVRPSAPQLRHDRSRSARPAPRSVQPRSVQPNRRSIQRSSPRAASPRPSRGNVQRRDHR